MKTILQSIILSILFITFSLANIINVPADIDSIQGGINLADDGDTVLVQPGTYMENINFNGKNIVVGSLTLTTGNTSYISQTIIEADSSITGWVTNRVVTISNGEDSTSVLCGFTLRNGYVGGDVGGGIYVSGANPHLSYLLVKNNSADYDDAGWWEGGSGGGIFLDSSNAILENVSVKNNDASESGGGISITSNSNPVVVNVKVTGNQSGAWGSIFCENSNPLFSNVTVTKNSAFYNGGITFDGVRHPYFDPINRCNIYNNMATGRIYGNDLLIEDSLSNIAVVLDTFTVLNPDSTHAYPLNKFTFNILNDTTGMAAEIENENVIPLKYSLNQNYPNPFNPSTKIKYILPKSEKVKIEVFNLLGQKITTLLDNQMPSGSHEVEFNGQNLSSGIYYYKIEAGEFQQVRKMLLIK